MPKWQDKPSKAEMDTYAALARPSPAERAQSVPMGTLSLNCCVGDVIQVVGHHRIWIQGLVGTEVVLRVTTDGTQYTHAVEPHVKLPLSETVDVIVTKVEGMWVWVAVRAPKSVKINLLPLSEKRR